MHLGKKLKAARLVKNLSLQDLADQMNGIVTRQMLHKYEAGVSVPSERVKHLLCYKLDIELEDFRPLETAVVHNGMFRRYKGYTTSETALIEWFKSKIDAYQAIEYIFQSHVPFINPLQGFEVNSAEDVEFAVEIVRMHWGIGMGIIASAVEAVENRGILCMEFDAEPEVNGFSGFIREDLTIPFMFINGISFLSDDRKRFTVFHEASHLLLPKLSIDEEMVANRFAGAMLLPKRTLINELGDRRTHVSMEDLGILKRKYGISMYAAMIRCKECGLISTSNFNELKAILDIDRTKEPVHFMSFEVPSRFNRLVSRAIQEQVLTQEEAVKFALKTLYVQ